MQSKMTIEYLPVKQLHEYSRNAKKHPAEQVEHIANSIREFGFRQPLVIDKDNVLVIGHGRLLAATKLGLDSVPCVRADDLTDEQIKALRLADNKTNESEWDFDLLGGELDDIFDIDMSEFGFELEYDSTEIDEVEHSSLNEQFVVPPFSILDTRQGYWQERKKAWKAIGIKSELGRQDNLLKMSKRIQDQGLSTSIFDPVLCEIMYKWFCPADGHIYDPFSGGSVRGIVAEKLGFYYFGIDLREEQIEANNKNAEEVGVRPTWRCDDSKNVDKYIEDDSQDMIFSCPPYGDLEKYSDDPRDISNMDYENFCIAYREIIQKASRKLKNDRFAVFVVGEIRDKNGFYRNFIDFTTECFEDCGLKKYNELILIESAGSAALRARKIFSGYRKICKTHQNVLVFYKGDPKKIKENYGEIEIDDSIFDDYAEK